MADARDQLRRYLEQRRELGESELVLDSLTVDDALRLLGVRLGAPAPADVRASTRETADRAPSGLQHDSVTHASDFGAAGDDWRATLRATGAAPEANMGKKSTSGRAPARATQGESIPPLDPGGAAEAAAAPDGLTGTSGGAGFAAAFQSLEELAESVAGCTRCPLYQTATKPVPGEGDPQADLMCVGEAPGANEDETGRPFIGAAGQLLTKILEAIDLPRDKVFICNVLKHRPPGNRNPLPDEVAACRPYLIRQIELVRPKVIIALGTFAAQTLLQTQLSLGKLRGQIHQFHGVPLVVTYHPAALLRNPSWKRPTWEDVQLARRVLDSAKPGA